MDTKTYRFGDLVALTGSPAQGWTVQNLLTGATVSEHADRDDAATAARDLARILQASLRAA